MQHSPSPQASEAFWFGSVMDSDACSLAAQSAQLARVDQGGLRGSVETAVRLLRMLDDPDFSVVEVARLIEGDPALTVRVLRAANSPMFSLRRACKEVGHAVTMLGARTMGEVAAAAAAADLFGRYGVESRLRNHAVSSAALARELARQTGRESRDLFLAGLLHDVGKLVLLQGAGEERYGLSGQTYKQILEQRASQVNGTHLLEQTALGFDHAALGQAALEAWGIPDPIPSVVGLHHNVSKALTSDERGKELACLLRVADYLAHAFEGPKLEDEAAQTQLREPAAMAALGLEVEELQGMIPQLRYVHNGAAGLLD